MNHGATMHFGIPRESFLGTYEILTGDEATLIKLSHVLRAGVTLPSHAEEQIADHARQAGTLTRIANSLVQGEEVNMTALIQEYHDI